MDLPGPEDHASSSPYDVLELMEFDPSRTSVAGQDEMMCSAATLLELRESTGKQADMPRGPRLEPVPSSQQVDQVEGIEDIPFIQLPDRMLSSHIATPMENSSTSYYEDLSSAMVGFSTTTTTSGNTSEAVLGSEVQPATTTQKSFQDSHYQQSYQRTTDLEIQPSTSAQNSTNIQTATVTPTQREALNRSIEHLRIPLAALVSVTTGQAHPRFPRSILEYHLLTHDQVDDLARWYHQTEDAGVERWIYPKPIKHAWLHGFYTNTNPAYENETEDKNEDGNERDGREGARRDGQGQGQGGGKIDLATKRRRFGNFIGLQGCSSPVMTHTQISSSTPAEDPSRSRPRSRPDEGEDEQTKDSENVTDGMDRRWLAALRRAEEEREIQEKCWRGHL